jgi:hypothetical protein
MSSVATDVNGHYFDQSLFCLVYSAANILNNLLFNFWPKIECTLRVFVVFLHFQLSRD